VCTWNSCCTTYNNRKRTCLRTVGPYFQYFNCPTILLLTIKQGKFYSMAKHILGNGVGYKHTNPLSYWTILQGDHTHTPVDISLARAGDVETNPGPSRWPCGRCDKAVKPSEYSIYCADCKLWFHRKCVGMAIPEIKSWSTWRWHCDCRDTQSSVSATNNATINNTGNPEKSSRSSKFTKPGGKNTQQRHVISKAEEEKLKKAYFSTKQPSSYGSITNLMKATGVGRAKVEQFLTTSKTYTKFKMAHRRKHFIRLKTKSLHINEIWSADLAFMEKLASSNDGVKYLLVAVDTLSRYLYVQPMANKTAAVAKTAFSKMITNSLKPKKLWVDREQNLLASLKLFAIQIILKFIPPTAKQNLLLPSEILDR
jgi:hypothetical protein